MDRAILTGVAAAVGVSVVGAAGCQVNATLNQATGENRQSGDKSRVFFGSSRDCSNLSSEKISALLRYKKKDGDESIKDQMYELFSKHDDYNEERSRNFIQEIHVQNPECGIKQRTWRTTTHMDIFQAFGAPGHMGVHSGLMIAYQGLDKWFITLSIDLTAIPVELLENGEIPESVEGSDTSFSGIKKCAVKHFMKVVDGIDDLIWEYKGSVNMSLLDLFNTVANAMKGGAQRGNYHVRGNNCIHFKNDILEAFQNNFQQDKKIPNKATRKIKQFDLLSNSNPSRG